MRRNLRRTLAFASAVFLLVGSVSAGAEEADAGETAFSGYLFRLKEDAPAAVSLMAEEEPEVGITPVLVDESVYKAANMEILSRYVDLDWVEYIEPNYYLELYGTPNDPHYLNGDQWQWDFLDLGYAWDRGIDGSGVTIGIIDSGLKRDHEDLMGPNILKGKNYIGQDEYDTEDTVGHGTFVTGLVGATTNNGIGVAGIAPGAKIVPLRCFSERTGAIDGVVQAIGDAVDRFKCDIINMSFGLYKEKMAAQGSTGDLKTLELALSKAEKAGVIMVAASGNEWTKRETINGIEIVYAGLYSYPASYQNVISVGSLDRRGSIASTSQRNDQVWVTAPGEYVYSSSFASDKYKTGSGTSYAAPIVSGVAALVKSVYPKLTGDQFMALLAKTASDLGEPGYDTTYGYGCVDIPALFRTVADELIGEAWIERTESGLRATVEYYDLPLNDRTVAIAAGYLENGRLAAVGQSELNVASWQTWVSIELSTPVPIAEVRVFLMDKDTWSPLTERVRIHLSAEGSEA